MNGTVPEDTEFIFVKVVGVVDYFWFAFEFNNGLG